MTYEWHTVDLVLGTPAIPQPPGVKGLNPDLTGIPGATGSVSFAAIKGLKALVLVEVRDGQ